MYVIFGTGHLVFASGEGEVLTTASAGQLVDVVYELAFVVDHLQQQYYRTSQSQFLKSPMNDDNQPEGFCRHDHYQLLTRQQSQALDKRFADSTALSLIDLQRPTDFLPRHLQMLPYSLAKQPFQIGQATICEEIEPVQVSQKPRKSLQQSQKPPAKTSLRQKYFGQCSPKLVYSRMQPDISEEAAQNFASNYIYLGNIFDYNPNQYCLLSENQHRQDNHSDSLEFESNFECGNLLYAFQTGTRQYDLVINNDTNSRGYTQWFLFKIKKMQKLEAYIFRIVNMFKKNSMYTEGLKPWVLKKTQQGNYEWAPAGQNITYDKTRILRELQQGKYYYQLSFQLTIKTDQQTVYIASNPPYSYSKLIRFLKGLQRTQAIQKTLSIATHSLSNNCIPILKFAYKNQTVRKTILLMARQHPGQTWPSFFIQQIIRELNSYYSDQVRWLLGHFQFVILPMINVDGVIYGNFRCDLNGFDMNRHWTDPKRPLDLPLIKIKAQLQEIHKQAPIVQALDLHGHSKKLNTFCYSCSNHLQQEPRVFPLVFSKLQSGFDFKQCTFGLDASKITTARSYISSLINSWSVMTVQSSTFGREVPSIGSNIVKPFSLSVISDMAKNLLKAMYIDHSGESVDGVSRSQCISLVKQNIEIYKQYQKRFNPSKDGSDSEPQEGELLPEQRKKNVLPDQSDKTKPILRPDRRRKKQRPTDRFQRTNTASSATNLSFKETKKLSIQKAYKPKIMIKVDRVHQKIQKPKIVKNDQTLTSERPKIIQKSKSTLKKGQDKSIRSLKAPSQKQANTLQEHQPQTRTRQISVQTTTIEHIKKPASKMRLFDKRTKFIKALNEKKFIEQSSINQSYLTRSNTNQESSAKIINCFQDAMFQVSETKTFLPLKPRSRQINAMSQSRKKSYSPHQQQIKSLAIIQRRRRKQSSFQKMLMQQPLSTGYVQHQEPISDPIESRTEPRRSQFLPAASYSRNHNRQKDLGLSHFSRIWRSNMKRYGRGITQFD